MLRNECYLVYWNVDISLDFSVDIDKVLLVFVDWCEIYVHHILLIDTSDDAICNKALLQFQEYFYQKSLLDFLSWKF